MNAITYTPDSQQIITTADDGKIKVWDVQSGFCVVTFTEHSSAVTACEFAKRGRVLFTASLDGSVRAWDMIRYRNFRTFTAPSRLSFSCLAIDPSGEVVCAGSIDSFEIYIWSVQTGQLLDQLSGHEGPISTLAFAPNGSALVSGSWDHTVRIWSIFERTQTSEPLTLQADVLSVAVRPDSKQIAVSTLDGELTFWSLSEATQEAGISGRRDVSGGRLLTDRRTAASSSGSKAFRSITYSVDGTCLLAGGNSKYLCLYAVSTLTLLKKYTVSINLSLAGTQEFLNSKFLTEAGPEGLIDTTGEAPDLEDRLDRTLPGTTRGDAASRKTMPTVRVTAVSFAPTGRAFCAATTEGLLVYSLDATLTFDPFDLDINITPSNTLATLQKKEYLLALVMAFRLNDQVLIRRVYEEIPPASILLIVRDIPSVYLARLIRFVAGELEASVHLEFNLLWLQALLSCHGVWLKEHAGTLAAELRAVQRAVGKVSSELGRLAEGNVYAVEFLLEQARLEKARSGRVVLDGDRNGNANGEMDTEMGDQGSEGDGEWIGLDSDGS
jgi:periodic tryptophan protein 2